MTIPARPTSYKGVTMRSRLEAGFAMWLDTMRWEWEYEPECFAYEGGQWLPDFHLIGVPCVWPDWQDGELFTTSTDVYVEVKPATLTAEESQQTKTRMCALYRTHVDAAAVLVREGTNPEVVWPDGSHSTPLDWTWTGLWPVDARRVEGPWPHEWWKGVAA